MDEAERPDDGVVLLLVAGTLLEPVNGGCGCSGVVKFDVDIIDEPPLAGLG